MKAAFKTLKANKKNLNKQQYRTLKGQILAGDKEAAMKGLNTLLSRKNK